MKLLIEYNACFKKNCISLQWKYKLYFTGGIWCPNFLEPTSELHTPVTFLLADKTQSVGIHLLINLDRKENFGN